MSLIGRDQELSAIGALLDRLRAGVGERLVVTGPAGAGKTALLAAAAELAAERGIRVEHIGHRALSAPAVPPHPPGPPGEPVLLLADEGTAEDLPGSGAPPGPRALLAAARGYTGDGTEMRLGGLSGARFAALVPGLQPDAVHALWLVSGGLPGPALSLAERLKGLPGDADPAVHLALVAPSRAQFLELDLGLVRLLEAAAERPVAPAVRARVLARLARELLADTTALARRRDLADTALGLARASGDPGTVAEVLDSRLHALWDPAATTERLATAGEIVAQARRAGDAATECRGLFWRFMAYTETGDLTAAEGALAVYVGAAEQAGHTDAHVVALARRAMLATVRGRFEEAGELADRILVAGHKAGVSDTERLAGSVRHQLAVVRGGTETPVEPWQRMARRLPGHFFEATAARAMLESGREVEAGLELERLLPSVLAGTGPRWIGALADLAVVASRTGTPAAAAGLYDALLPYQGRLVVWGGANTVTGPVDDYLGRVAARLDRPDAALGHLNAAAELSRGTGALPGSRAPWRHARRSAPGGTAQGTGKGRRRTWRRPGRSRSGSAWTVSCPPFPRPVRRTAGGAGCSTGATGGWRPAARRPGCPTGADPVTCARCWRRPARRSPRSIWWPAAPGSRPRRPTPAGRHGTRLLPPTARRARRPARRRRPGR